MKIGFTLSSEEFGPSELVRLGALAERAGFEFLMISDHFHPWIDKQGQSPFVWNVIGSLSEATSQVPIGVGVSGTILRMHPAILAQAAATSQVQLQGRFVMGVGSGENLNEHVVGMGWPPISIRREMLNEMVEILRLLWQGGYQSYRGTYYVVEDAKLYTLPDVPPPLLYSAFGPVSAEAAGIYGDGFVTTSPNKELVGIFQKQTKEKKPVYGQLSVCFEKRKKIAKELLRELWPLSGLPGQLNTELRLPSYFEDVATLIDVDDLSSKYVIGRDKEGMLGMLDRYKKAGFSHVYIHNIGPHQEAFIKWFSRVVMPVLR